MERPAGRVVSHLFGWPGMLTDPHVARHFVFSVQPEEFFTHPPCTFLLGERLRKNLTCTLEGGVQDENMLT